MRSLRLFLAIVLLSFVGEAKAIDSPTAIEEIHSILKDKEGFENGWKMVSFISTEMPVVEKIVKNADDMTDLGKFFAKYGDEAGGLLKKFGDDLADEAFEVYKRGGKLEFTRNILKDPKGKLAWLEEGNDAGGWIHIKKKHITGQISGGSKFPDKFGVDDEQIIENWIYNSIRSIEPTKIPDYPDRWQYIYEPFNDGRKMKTIMDNGYIT